MISLDVHRSVGLTLKGISIQYFLLNRMSKLQFLFDSKNARVASEHKSSRAAIQREKVFICLRLQPAQLSEPYGETQEKLFRSKYCHP